MLRPFTVHVKTEFRMYFYILNKGTHRHIRQFVFLFFSSVIEFPLGTLVPNCQRASFFFLLLSYSTTSHSSQS